MGRGGTPALGIPKTPDVTGAVPTGGNDPVIAIKNLLNYQVRDSQGQNLGQMENLLFKMSPTVLAAQLLGYEVWQQSNGPQLGDIQDLVVDMTGQRIPYAVLAVGGVLTADKKLVLVPMGTLAFDGDAKVFRASFDQKTLEQAPGFAQDQWPDFSQPNWDAKMRGFWRSRTAQ